MDVENNSLYKMIFDIQWIKPAWIEIINMNSYIGYQNQRDIKNKRILNKILEKL